MHLASFSYFTSPKTQTSEIWRYCLLITEKPYSYAELFFNLRYVHNNGLLQTLLILGGQSLRLRKVSFPDT